MVIVIALWVLWNFRSTQIFGSMKPKNAMFFYDVVAKLFCWIFNRRKKCAAIKTLFRRTIYIFIKSQPIGNYF